MILLCLTATEFLELQVFFSAVTYMLLNDECGHHIRSFESNNGK